MISKGRKTPNALPGISHPHAFSVEMITVGSPVKKALQTAHETC